MQNENKITIILDMLHLKMVVVEEVDLVILISQVTSRIYLKIFLEILVEVVEGLEKQILEDQI